jgi:glutamine synthetase
LGASLKKFYKKYFDAVSLDGKPCLYQTDEYHQSQIVPTSPGQFEITLHHRDDALRAVDEAVMFKRVLRGVAQKHGLIACFMAKPFTERAGSGLHVHVSFNDAQGHNIFASDDPAGAHGINNSLLQVIGGMKDSMAESMVVFAPNANSYRRFVTESYAPVAPNWGINNRSVSLRVPAGPPASRHVEHRICGADANLYLAVATVMGGAAHGLRERFDPGAPIEGNGYAQAGVRTLPGSWREALDLAARSEFLEETLGKDFLRIFLSIKNQECARFSAEVSELDYAWYLRS